MTRRWPVRSVDRPAGRQVPPKGADEASPRSGVSVVFVSAGDNFAPRRELLLSPTAPFLPTAEEMGERTPAETAFLHFLSALCLFTAARAFPHVTGVFLIVVVPPTVPAQFSAAAAACCGRNLSSTELQPSNISYPVPDGHTYLCRRKAAKARFDNRHSTSAPTPTLTASAAAAQAVQAIPRTDIVTHCTSCASAYRQICMTHSAPRDP